MTTEVLVFLREVQSAIAKSNSLSGALRVVPLHSTYHIRLEYVAVLILIVAGGSSNQKEACLDGLESRLKPRSLAGQQAAQPSGSAPPVRLGVFCSFLRPSRMNSNALFHRPHDFLESCIHTRFRCRCLRPLQAAEWPQDDMAVAFGQDTSKAEGFFLDMLRAAALSKSSLRFDMA